jgi:O-antigen/teichoic acid export membrane protein
VLTHRLPPSAWNALAWLANVAYGFASSALIYRFIGPGDYGVWATVLALRGFLVLFENGLGIGLTRDVAMAVTGEPAARERIAVSRALYLAFAVLAVSAAIAGAALPATLLHLDPRAAEAARWTMMLMGLEAALLLVVGRVTAALRGGERFDRVAVIAALQAVVGVALILTLGRRFGLVGAAVAAVCARGAGALASAAWMRSERAPDGRGKPHRPSAVAVRAVLAVAVPLWVMALASQLGGGTDVPIVGHFYGPERASDYALGTAVPQLCAGLLFAVMAVFFPRLATMAQTDLARLVPKLAFKACVLAALGFGVLIQTREAVLQVWVGTAPPLSMQVMLLYALAWVCNAPSHVVCLAAIARGRHAVITAITLPEALASFVLSLLLAKTWRPEAPAVVTLTIMAVTNLGIVPAVLLLRLGIPWRQFVRGSIAGLALGAGLSAMIGLLVRAGQGSPLVTVVLAAAGTLACVYGLWRVLLGNTVAPRRLAILLGGVGDMVRRERLEIAEVRRRIATERARAPEIWTPASPPLVTVHIATYNRGKLIAERAIASVLAQTHQNLEVVVVGDCCDQATADAVLAVRDPRVRFENLAVRGPYPEDAWARWMVAGTAPVNRALELARGEWITPLDDDDEFTPDHIEVLLDECKRRRLELVYGVAAMEVETGKWQHVGQWPPREGHIAHQAVLYWGGLKFWHYWPDCWRLEEPGDWNMWRKMRKAGVRMGFLDRVVCRHYLERREFRGTAEQTLAVTW